MRRRGFRAKGFCIVLLFVATTGALDAMAHGAAMPDLESQYSKARRQYQRLLNQLQDPQSQALFRKNIETFQEIIRQDAKQQLTDRCLFMIAQSHHRLHDVLKSEHDYRQALAFYKRLALRFPQSPLADDALFLSGILLEAKEPAEAYLEFSRLCVLFPQGDWTPKARQKAEALASALSGTASIGPSAPSLTAAEDGKAKPGGKGASSDQGAKTAPGRSTAPMSLKEPKVTVEKIRHWSGDDYTRVAVYLSGPVRYSRSEFPADPEKKQPQRIVLELERCGVGPSIKPMIPIMNGFLRDVRLKASSDEKTQVIVDLQSVESYRVFSLADPSRVVIDVQGKKKPTSQATAQPTTPTASPPAPTAKPVLQKGMPSIVEQLGLTVRRIVIDPGHGGKDKGAIGPGGVYEKDITLAVAKELKKVLEKEGGYEVFLTRNTDRYLSLEERTAIANTKKADLFISIHTNAHEDSNLGGIETYFLNFSKDKESARLAALENATSAKHISDLEAILNELLRHTKINESSRLAREIHQGMMRGLEAHPNLRDLGVKQAPFYVLLGAQMPSVLIEACFISNPQEERLLKQPQFQRALAKAISKGIRSYRDRLAHVSRLGEDA
ncbi:MAG: N-acetylmuramoyl-L-alanine amidase [Desulfosoma sp.]|uniref:N-acetylmuramoyl-L-alanine amidase n=1 Tax=Desulfosoma sp. TaxID=2603217 RepID=UPI0040498877